MKPLKAVISGLIMGISIPLIISCPSLIPPVSGAIAGMAIGIIYGVVYFALHSRLPGKNPLLKSMVLGLYMLFLPIFAIISFVESMILIPAGTADVSWFFYLWSSALLSSFWLLPVLVFGLAYWAMEWIESKIYPQQK